MTVGAFGGYLSSVFPSQINVDVTMFCNLACIHCPYETVTKLKGKGRQNLDIDLHTKLIDEIATVGRGHCRFLRYTGDGEPLLHPHLAKMLSYAFERTGLPINVTTNGMLLTEQRARALIEAGVAVFDVSIDAHSQEVYGQVRVKGILEITYECTHRLIRLTKEYGGKAKVMVSFVRQPLNLHEADAFEAYWKAAGADFVVMRNLHSCAGNVPEMSEKMWATAPATRKPCLYPWERMVLKADGELTFCPADWKHIANIGNFKESSISEIWQGEAMQALRNAHLSGDFSKHSFCGGCPDWSVIKWPDEGRSYATVMHEFDAQLKKRPDAVVLESDLA
jgi:radical SAM protein with 4Fe4S-binding SPASM domain